MKEATTSFGHTMRMIRCGKGLTQTDLGKLCGMADSQIGVYERGETIPGVKNKKRIADALGVSVETLESGKEYK